jgi:hypothetical protein
MSLDHEPTALPVVAPKGRWSQYTQLSRQIKQASSNPTTPPPPRTGDPIGPATQPPRHPGGSTPPHPEGISTGGTYGPQ